MRNAERPSPTHELDSPDGRLSSLLAELSGPLASRLLRLSRTMPGDTVLICGPAADQLALAVEAVSGRFEVQVAVDGPATGSDKVRCGISTPNVGQVSLDATAQSALARLHPGGRLIVICPGESASVEAARELLHHAGFIHTFCIPCPRTLPRLPGLVQTFIPGAQVLAEKLPWRQSPSGLRLVCGTAPGEAAILQGDPAWNRSALRGHVSVVIPCRNEEETIGPLLCELFRLYRPLIQEVLPIDDNSTDGTREILSDWARREPRVRPVFRSAPNGVGRALRDGFAAARGEWILTMDADFVELLPELRGLFEAAEDGCPVVRGSRFSPETILAGYPFGKLLSNRVFHTLLPVVLCCRPRDVTNNLKLIHRSVLSCLTLAETGFGANAETGCLPLLAGYRCRESPVSWINRTEEMGTSSFRVFSAAPGYIRVLCRLMLARLFRVGPYSRIVGLARRDLVTAAQTLPAQ